MMVDARDVAGRQAFHPLDIGLLLARFPVGLLFFLAGVGKLKGGVGNFVEHADKAIPSFLPLALGVAYLHAVPFAEVLVGLSIMLGIFTRIAGLISSLMLISFMIAVTGIHPSGREPLQYNIVLLGISLCLMLVGPGRYSADAMLPERSKKQ